MPVKITVFLLIHHNEITSIASERYLRKQSHCNNQTIAKELALISSVQAKWHFKACLVSLHSFLCSRTEAGCWGAAKSMHSCCFSWYFPSLEGKRTFGLKITQGLQLESPAEGEQLSAYINLSLLVHISICCSSGLAWQPSGFSREARKDPKGIKRMMTPSIVCGVGFYHLWMKPVIRSQNTVSNAPGFLLFLSASVQRLKQVLVVLITGLKRSKTQREPCQQALLSHPAGMSRVANCLLNWISRSALQQKQNKRCHNYNFIPWLPASAWQQ